jgi:hypothetical protein
MPDVRTCWDNTCHYNRGGCYCNAPEVEIAADHECLTYEEKDIYAEAEGFGRDA